MTEEEWTKALSYAQYDYRKKLLTFKQWYDVEKDQLMRVCPEYYYAMRLLTLYFKIKHFVIRLVKGSGTQ